MSKEFVDALSITTNVAHTENGAVAFDTTKSAMLDLFAQGGALRNRDDDEILHLFSKAYAENALLATRAMFYFRDARGGQGERDTFRKQLKWLINVNPDAVRKNIKLIPYFGRWDDLYVLFDTELETDAIALIFTQITEDVASEHPSLLAKWLKSENASSKETKRLATKTRKGLKLRSKAYRLMLSTLRKKINIVERLVSANQWDSIEYSAVPSQANLLYGKAFFAHDAERRKKFLDSLKTGEKKINASVLFPYEIVRKAFTMGRNTPQHERQLMDALWDALPNYIGDKQENALAVVDVSGSMAGLPLEVAISVGMYLAERNTCEAYHNKFITFSSTPQLLKIQGADLVEKIANMNSSAWEMNTDIQAVFRLILTVAKQNKLAQSELPQKLYIISDMEFDAATSNARYSYEHQGRGMVDEKLFQTISKEFGECGYTMPNLVFWNVDAQNQQFPMSMDERGFQMVSGCSPSIFKHTIGGEFLSAYDLMLDVINSERYQLVTI